MNHENIFLIINKTLPFSISYQVNYHGEYFLNRVHLKNQFHHDSAKSFRRKIRYIFRNVIERKFVAQKPFLLLNIGSNWRMFYFRVVFFLLLLHLLWKPNAVSSFFVLKSALWYSWIKAFPCTYVYNQTV